MLQAAEKGTQSKQQTLFEVGAVRVVVKRRHADFGYTDPSYRVVRRALLRDWDSNEERWHRLLQSGIPFRVLSQDRHYKPAKKHAAITSLTSTQENSANLIASTIYNPDETKASLKLADEQLVRIM